MKNNTNLNKDKTFAEIGDLRKELIMKYLLSNCTCINVPLKNFMNEFEKEMLIRTLKISGGSQRVAAFILGVKPTTLSEKIKKYKLKGMLKVRYREDLKNLVRDIYQSSQ